VAGFGSDCSGAEQSESISSLMKKIRGGLSEKNTAKNGFTGKPPAIDFYTAPLFADDVWIDVATSPDSTLNVVTASESERDGKLASRATSLTDLAEDDNTVGAFHSVMDWVSSRIDLLILLWDGSESAHGGALLAAARAATANEIPCVRIDTGSLSVYCEERLDERVFTDRKLAEYISCLYDVESDGLDDDASRKGRFPFSGVWSALYRNFRKKHDRSIQFLQDPDDPILHDSYFEREGDCPHSRNHKKLVSFYGLFDARANAISKQYREAIYFRSILPFAATVFLAIGFYIETIGRFCFPAVIGPEQYALFSVLSFAAGIGFLAHAMINFYAYKMSGNPRVKNQLHQFINSRYCAEYLRNAIYFMPFGIPVKKKIVRPLDAVQINKDTIRLLDRILRSLEPSAYSFDREHCQEALRNMSQMLDDQIVYNENTRRRYEKIAEMLERLSVIIFYIGFFIVIGRGVFQFLIPELQRVFGASFTDSVRNGKSLKDFLQSFTNMLALMLPAWGSYFSSKLTLNSFRDLAEHASIAGTELKKLEGAVNQAKLRDAVSYETLHSLAEEILELQFSDLTSWYALTATKNVTKL
jgi:hypothetical protein